MCSLQCLFLTLVVSNFVSRAEPRFCLRQFLVSAYLLPFGRGRVRQPSGETTLITI